MDFVWTFTFSALEAKTLAEHAVNNDKPMYFEINTNGVRMQSDGLTAVAVNDYPPEHIKDLVAVQGVDPHHVLRSIQYSSVSEFHYKFSSADDEGDNTSYMP